MSNMDHSNGAVAETSRMRAELWEARQKLIQYPWRPVGLDENNWTPTWLAQIGQIIIDVLESGKVSWKDGENIKFLLDHDLITFRDGDNQLLPLVKWDSDGWYTRMFETHDYVRIFMKSAAVLPLPIHKKLVEGILQLVSDSKLETIKMFAFDVIRTSFAKSEAVLNPEITFSALRTCRQKTFEASLHASLYMDFWRTILSVFPKNNPGYSTTLLAGHNILSESPEDQLLIQPTEPLEIYILGNLLNQRNPVYLAPAGEQIPYKLAMLKLLAILDFKNLGNVFNAEVSENLILKGLFSMIHNFCDNWEQHVIDECWEVVWKLCAFLRSHDCPKLKTHMEQLRESLLTDKRKDYDIVRMAFDITYECGSGIEALEWQVLHDHFLRAWSYEEDGEARYEMAQLYVAAIHPSTNCNELEEVEKLLGYGSERFCLEWDPKLSIKQIRCLASHYGFELSLRNGYLYRKDYHERNFGRHQWDYDSFPCYFNIIGSLEMAQIGKHLKELEQPEEKRVYLHPSKGLAVFEWAADIGMTLILEIFHKNRILLKSKFQIKNCPPMNVFGERLMYHKYTLLKKEELGEFYDLLEDEMSEYLDGTNKYINDYFVPLVEMVAISMEVMGYERACEKFYEHFYVPTVRALLATHPELGMKLVVAFCRAELRINLSATYPNTEKFKLDWQRIKSLKTPEMAKEHFQKSVATLNEVYECSYSPHRDEYTLMDRFVSATVNHHQMYSANEVKDFLVVSHYYDKLSKRGINDETLWSMTNEEVHGIFLDDGDNK